MSFDNGFARNVVIFGVDNSSSSHSKGSKNNISVQGEGPTNGINRSFGLPEKKLSINFDKSSTNVCLGFYYNVDAIICLLMEKNL